MADVIPFRAALPPVPVPSTVLAIQGLRERQCELEIESRANAARLEEVRDALATLSGQGPKVPAPKGGEFVEISMN